jgi:DNA-directed RNA polymerase
MNTATRKLTQFEVASMVATEFMNSINLSEVPNFGIEPVQVLERGEIVTKERGVEAILVSVNLIIANSGSFDVWLSEALSTSMKQFVPLEVSTAINRWLIDKGLVNRRATTTKVLRNDRIFERKIWGITPEWQKRIDALRNVEKRTYAPQSDIAEVCINHNVKGASKASYESIGALEKLNATALRFHPATLEFCEQAEGLIRDKGTKATRDRYGNVTRAASQVLEDKIREIDAVAAEFSARGNEPLFLEHEQDSRGRIYAKGGWISTQSSKLQKAALRFAMPEASSNDDEILIYLGRLAGSKGTNAEAALKGLQQLENPTSIEAVSVISQPETAIVRLDGTCNGIQWISAFGADTEGMRLTNLLGNEIADLYTEVQKRLDLCIRDQAKAIVMPRGYGASAWSISNNLRESGMRVSPDDVALMLDEISNIIPIDKFLGFIEGKAKYRLKGRESLSWSLPDGFRVVHEYREYDTIKGGHSFEVKIGEGRIDTRKMIAALAPNIIHSIDSYHARLVITQCPFPVIAIHDSFGCHSSNVPMLRKVIRKTFQQIIREDVLNSIMEQIGLPRYADPVDPDLITNPFMFM